MKASLDLFLNEGGSLEELELKIEVSDEVKNKVKENEKLLEDGNKVLQRERVMNAYNEEYAEYEIRENR